ncbi:MAG: 5'-nucleotidase C-terminal domain-containing protein [Saprospiraceae bacterium]
MGCSTTQNLPTANQSIVEFTILQINDVYEIAPIEGGAVGGLARVAQLKKQLLAENPNTIAVIAGDFLSPSLIATLKLNGERIAGLQMVEALNSMGMDYATFGNHEFDISDPKVLQKRIDQSEFRFVSSNAWFTEGGIPRPFTQQVKGKVQEVPPYLVHEFQAADGKSAKVAIIGTVLPFNKADYVHYLPVEESFRKAYQTAKQEANMVVGLTHLNMDEDIALAKAVPGLALFMGGHEHVNLNHYIEKTIITKADANAKTAYVHRVKLDLNSGLSDIQSTLVPIDESIPEEPQTAAIVARWQQQVGKILTDMGFEPQQSLMKTKVPLVCTEALIRTQPTNFGKLTCEAMLQAFPDVDIPIINSGSMRLDDDLNGQVIAYDILRTFPFGGAIVTMEVPGKALNSILNKGLLDNHGEGGYFQLLQVSGQRDQWSIKNQPLNLEATYKIAIPKFVAEGKEARLELLADYPFIELEKVRVKGSVVKNDIRNIVIAYMQGL